MAIRVFDKKDRADNEAKRLNKRARIKWQVTKLKDGGYALHRKGTKILGK